MREILRRYGNFMSGYDADGDEIDIDEAIRLMGEEIEKSLLKEGEIEKVVDDWTNEDYSVRSIQLDRGHWEYIAPVVAQAQVNNILKILD